MQGPDWEGLGSPDQGGTMSRQWSPAGVPRYLQQTKNILWVLDHVSPRREQSESRTG